MKKYFAILILTGLIAGLAACSIVDGNRYEYFGYGGSVYDAKMYSGEQPTAKEIPTKKQRDWKNPLAESSSKEAVPQDPTPIPDRMLLTPHTQLFHFFDHLFHYLHSPIPPPHFPLRLLNHLFGLLHERK